MVGQLTYGKRQWESLDGEMRALIPLVDKASKEMVDFVDADTSAFKDYMVGEQCRRTNLCKKGFE